MWALKDVDVVRIFAIDMISLLLYTANLQVVELVSHCRS